MGVVAELYVKRTGKHYFSNINHVDNIPSIIEQGILSHESAQSIVHQSVAMESVQNRRNSINIPNGLKLHQYASLYFTPRNPMMYYLKSHRDINTLCVLMISTEVLDLEGTVISDGNAASEITRFYMPYEGIAILDYVSIFAKYWTDPYEQDEKKRRKCAEVLVPYRITPEYIIGALVPSEETGILLRNIGFNEKIIVNPDLFFLAGGDLS